VNSIKEQIFKAVLKASEDGNLLSKTPGELAKELLNAAIYLGLSEAKK
jgi:hypothetical protein